MQSFPNHANARQVYLMSTLRVRKQTVQSITDFTVIMAKRERAAYFTAAEQRLLVEAYQEYKETIEKKGNTVAITKTRQRGWQAVADRLNA